MSIISAQMGNAITTTQDDWPEERIQLLVRTICKGATPDELQLFLSICKRTKLDPFSKQIFAIKRWDSGLKREVMQPQLSIDGQRIVAERSGEYAGQEGPFWCGSDGAWTDVWLKEEMPQAAKVIVYKKGQEKGTPAVAHLSEYIQKNKEGRPTTMWNKMPALMLAKCAESLALRKAFPNDLSGLYTVEELPPENPYEAKRIERPTADVAITSHSSTMPNETRAAAAEPVRDTGFAAAPPIVAQFKQAEMVGSMSDYELPSGQWAGNRLKDKPPEFWFKYKAELEEKLKANEIPLKHVGGAREIVGAIHSYLSEKV